jgi:hypothetical protein
MRLPGPDEDLPNNWAPYNPNVATPDDYGSQIGEGLSTAGRAVSKAFKKLQGQKQSQPLLDSNAMATIQNDAYRNGYGISTDFGQALSRAQAAPWQGQDSSNVSLFGSGQSSDTPDNDGGD